MSPGPTNRAGPPKASPSKARPSKARPSKEARAIARTTIGPGPGATAIRWLTAVLVPLLTALDLPVTLAVSSGTAIVLISSPAWFGHLLRQARGPVLAAASAGFVVTGSVLAWWSMADHEVQTTIGVLSAASILTSLGAVGALVWAAHVIRVEWVVLLYAAGLLAAALLHPSSWGENPWKYAFALPVTLIVLSLVDGWAGGIGPRLAALAALGAMSISWDHRSGFAMFLVTAMALGWQRLRRRAVREPSLLAVLLVVVAVAGVLNYVLTRLLVSGWLGEGVRARSEAQVESSGSLLLGGRPEWTVTIRLFLDRPYGFGFGTVPSPHDYALGREGFASIHLLSQVNYLKNYVFDATFRLHSIIADLWANGGPAGVGLALVMVWILLGALARDLARRTATATAVFLVVLSQWNLGFSPSFTNLPQVSLALAVALVAYNRPPAEDRRAVVNGAPLP